MDWLNAIIVGTTAIIASLGTLVITFAKTKKQIEETIPRKLKRQNNIDMEIVNKMEELKEILQADRIQVYDFHNGGHYANGRSALKTSCTYEVTRAGIRSIQTFLQAIPLSCIPQFTRKILNEDILEVQDLETIKNTMPSTYHLKKDFGVKSFYDIILNNRDGEPIGFLGIQYVNKAHKTYNSNDINEILRLKFYIEENLEKLVIK